MRKFSIFNKDVLNINQSLKILIYISTLFSFLLASKIEGTVVDEKTGAALVGANVFLLEVKLDKPTDMGGASDVDGNYLIPDISSGRYILVCFYMGYDSYRKPIKISPGEDYEINISLAPSVIEIQETKVTAKKRQQKITEAPASVEIVSNRDIRRQSTTNIGSYLKGLKGVDFTSSGINNYSITVRGFNSSFSTRLLTLTDGRVANIPALRVINYSTIPQSTDDIEKMEVVLGPATALYGANAHSGVVNIISKSPADSEGFTMSVSGTNDDRELRKINARLAKKITNSLSVKLSGSYLHAYEWPYVSEEEHKRHSYPWAGHPSRIKDGLDNNPHNTPPAGVVGSEQYQNLIAISSEECIDFNDNGINDPGECKRIGDGEKNHEDWDGDGFAGEDWVNGYDDDGDGRIDEDYFYADGIDNDGDGNIDEFIDGYSDKYLDGYDNDQNGYIDDSSERASTEVGYDESPAWGYNLDERNILIDFGRENEYINYYDSTKNVWFEGSELGNLCVEGILLSNGQKCSDPHLKGDFVFDEDNTLYQFDVFIYDYGSDGVPGDGAWDDSAGDDILQVGEPLNASSVFGDEQDVGLDGIAGTNDEGEGDGIWQPGDGWVDTNGNGVVDRLGGLNSDTYTAPTQNDTGIWPPKNGIWDEGEEIYDYGQDGFPDTGDPGENDGNLIVLDLNERDGMKDTGDGIYGYAGDSFVDLNNNGVYDEGTETYVDGNADGSYTPPDYKENFQRVNDTNGDGLDDYPDLEVDNRKIEMRIDFDPTEDLSFSFQSGYSYSKTQQVTGTSRYLADGFTYTYYQLRSRYKNWFHQIYLNQSNSGDTRGYNQGNVIRDESRNIASQIQNNFKIKPLRSKIIWGVDYFRTEPKSNGTILNDGPNGYDNDADNLYLAYDGIDNDGNGLIDDNLMLSDICYSSDGENNTGKTSFFKDGRIWQCGEGIDEPDEFIDPISNELGGYFQTQTNIFDNDVLELILAARFDYNDILDEGVQFGPKLGLIYKPTELSTFRFTYGKAYNTPTSIALNTDLFIQKYSILDVFLRGNKDGTPYQRVDGEYDFSKPQYYDESGNLQLIKGTDEYFDGNASLQPYQDRIQGAPYFFNMLDGELAPSGDFIPLDTHRYVIYVPELNDEGVLYTPEESIGIKDIDPLKTEKIQSFEFGYKGFLGEKFYINLDAYLNIYEDFFSPPTVITPMVVLRKYNSDGVEITSLDSLDLGNDFVGFLTVNDNYTNPPYGTAWNGLDDDGDWAEYMDDFGWEDDKDGDGDPRDNGEFGWVDVYGNIFRPEHLLEIDNGEPNVRSAYDSPYYDCTQENIDCDKSHWNAVGIDEYYTQTGLNEAEYIASFDAGAGEEVIKGKVWAPPQLVLSPVNYGTGGNKITMRGIDFDITYLLPQYKLFLSANFSFYGTSDFYNELTRKNDPINAPKFKWNGSAKWDTDYGNFMLTFRHVDQFQWKDGIWSGIIGPYNLLDLHYNYKLFESLEMSVSAMNIGNDVHRELVGGAKMGRQIVFRLTSTF